MSSRSNAILAASIAVVFVGQRPSLGAPGFFDYDGTDYSLCKTRAIPLVFAARTMAVRIARTGISSVLMTRGQFQCRTVRTIARV